MSTRNPDEIAENAKKAIDNVEELLNMLNKVEDMARATSRLVGIQARNIDKTNNALDPRDLGSIRSSRKIEK